jgi:CRP-like cAMP-binding protein
MGLNPDEMDKLDRVISSRRRIKRGTALFNSGDKFTSLYAVRSGFFKTCVTTADGRDQVTGFQMTGEIIGLDGIATPATRSPWKTPKSASCPLTRSKSCPGSSPRCSTMYTRS